MSTIYHIKHETIADGQSDGGELVDQQMASNKLEAVWLAAALLITEHTVLGEPAYSFKVTTQEDDETVMVKCMTHSEDSEPAYVVIVTAHLEEEVADELERLKNEAAADAADDGPYGRIS